MHCKKFQRRLEEPELKRVCDVTMYNVNIYPHV